MISIGNETASLTVDLCGGAITGFRLLDGGINPLTFKLGPEDMPPHNRTGASYRGHFICLGRWGPPSPGEIKAGIPDHGQAANLTWELITPDAATGSMTNADHSSPLERGRAASAVAGVCNNPPDKPQTQSTETDSSFKTDAAVNSPLERGRERNAR